MIVEGRLMIDLIRSGDGAGTAVISSSRPLRIPKAFQGKSIHDTVRTLPLLFSVCSLAQGAAAAEACERALGIAGTAATRDVRTLLVLAETLREHVIRTVMDWPRAVGLEAKAPDLRRAMRASEDLRRALDPHALALTVGADVEPNAIKLAKPIAEFAALIEDLVLGERIGFWGARRSAHDLEEWARQRATAAQVLVSRLFDRGWASAGASDVRFLPALASDDLADDLLGPHGDAFVAAPTWIGSPHETSVLARQAETPLVQDLMRLHGSGLLTRISARLAEIADLPHVMRRIAEGAIDGEEGRVRSAPLGAGRGLSQIEAARGRLIHGVEIAADVVKRYSILAPTEWNFHPRGAATQGLSEIAGRGGGIRELAELFICAVDPCVGYEVRVH